MSNSIRLNPRSSLPRPPRLLQPPCVTAEHALSFRCSWTLPSSSSPTFFASDTYSERPRKSFSRWPRGVRPPAGLGRRSFISGCVLGRGARVWVELAEPKAIRVSNQPAAGGGLSRGCLRPHSRGCLQERGDTVPLLSVARSFGGVPGWPGDPGMEPAPSRKACGVCRRAILRTPSGCRGR